MNLYKETSKIPTEFDAVVPKNIVTDVKDTSVRIAGYSVATAAMLWVGGRCRRAVGLPAAIIIGAAGAALAVRKAYKAVGAMKTNKVGGVLGGSKMAEEYILIADINKPDYRDIAPRMPELQQDLAEMWGKTQMSKATKMPAPQIIFCDYFDKNYRVDRSKSRKLNLVAMASGLGAESFMVSAEALRKLTKREMRAVIAHEVAHASLNHVGLHQFTGIVRQTTAILGLAALGASFFTALPFWGTLGVMVGANICTAMAHSFISRRHEKMADLISVRLSRDPLALASAIKKIDESHEPEISVLAKIGELFKLHPLTAIRVAYLEKAAKALGDKVEQKPVLDKWEEEQAERRAHTKRIIDDAADFDAMVARRKAEKEARREAYMADIVGRTGPKASQADIEQGGAVEGGVAKPQAPSFDSKYPRPGHDKR